ncbi:uncharacterized protein [Ptychodera flava]|uniref:uncharacterized protein n=1 Tax=Ptychodera flava TaxID=63121 RepID=UPI00396A6EDF
MEYRFTRVIFGATSSPYILGVTLQKHIEDYEQEYPATVHSLLKIHMLTIFKVVETKKMMLLLSTWSPPKYCQSVVSIFTNGIATSITSTQRMKKRRRYLHMKVKKIGELTESKWRYVPTAENPSNLGTRGSAPSRLGTILFQGPSWLSSEGDRPVQPEIFKSEGAKSEKKSTKKTEVMLLLEDAIQNETIAWSQELLSKFKFWKILRITSYMKHFIDGCKGMRQVGPLTKSEITASEKVWIHITQQTNNMTSDVTLAADEDRILRCYGRVPGYNPVLIPRRSALARRIIEHCHLQTLHGGVATTMSKPFGVSDIDFAGPLIYKSEKYETSKTYIALFTCASTRAVHLKLCRDLSVNEFKRQLKKFVAKRGSPSVVVSDNAKTFIATKRWLSTLQRMKICSTI